MENPGATARNRALLAFRPDNGDGLQRVRRTGAPAADAAGGGNSSGASGGAVAAVVEQLKSNPQMVTTLLKMTCDMLGAILRKGVR